MIFSLLRYARNDSRINNFEEIKATSSEHVEICDLSSHDTASAKRRRWQHFEPHAR